MSSDLSGSQGLRISWLGLGLVYCTPALGGFLYGYDIGATAFVLAMVRADASGLYDDDDAVENNNSAVWWQHFGRDGGVQEGLFISGMSLGALLGSHLVLFHFAHTMGRRMELRVASLLYLIGALLHIASGTIFATSSSLGWPLLFVGRILFGMGIGFTMHGAPNYMAEMSPSHIRGAIVSSKETVLVGGMVFGFVVGDYLSRSSQGDWTTLYQVSVMLSLPMLMLTFMIPRSVRWLLTRHDDVMASRHEAKDSLQFVYRDDVTAELEHMIRQVVSNRLQKQPSTPAASGDGVLGTLGALFFDTSVTPSLVIALGLIFLMEASGQPALLSYITLLFQEAGWGGHISVVNAVIMLSVSSLTTSLVDIVGRKRLLQASAGIMCLALTILSINAPYIWIDETDNYSDDGTADSLVSVGPRWQRMVVLIFLFVYVGSYQLGFGPITWVIVAEVFPAHVRGQASALAVEFKYILQFLVQFSVPVLQQQLGWRLTFGIFALFTAYAAIYFIPNMIPETKGMTLEQIEQAQSQSYHKAEAEGTLNDDDDANSSSHASVATEELSTEQTQLLGGARTFYSNMVV